LWNPIYKAWFPEGLDDPTLCLLKISVEEAEYWDSPNSKLVQIAGFVKALVTGQSADGGEYGRVNF
jgi:general stress protein 26